MLLKFGKHTLIGLSECGYIDATECPYSGWMFMCVYTPRLSKTDAEKSGKKKTTGFGKSVKQAAQQQYTEGIPV